MVDLRIVDAPVLLKDSITDDVKMPTGGLGNYAIRLGDLVWYVVTKEQLASKDYVDHSSNGVQDNLGKHIDSKDNPHRVTKAQVGLGNVDNTADADKPISNATKSALLLKSDLADTYNKNEIDVKLGSVSGGYIGAYSTLAELQTKTGMTTGQVAKVMNDSESTKNGDYYYDGNSWVKGYDSLTTSKNYTDVKFTESKDYTDAQLTKIIGTNSDGAVTVVNTGVDYTDWSGFAYGFAYPFKITSATTVNQIALKIGQNDTTNKKLKVTLRDSTVNGTVLATITKSSNVLFGTSTALTDVTLDFADLQLNANQTVYVIIELLDTNNVRRLINTGVATAKTNGAVWADLGGNWVEITQAELPTSSLLYKSNATVLSKIADTTASISAINDNFIARDEIVATNAFNKYFWLENTLTAWAVGVKVENSVKPTIFAPVLFGLDKAHKLNLKCYKRVLGSINTQNIVASDIKILDKDYIVTDVLNPKINAWAHFDFDISDIGVMQSDSAYRFEIKAFDIANNRVNIGAGRSDTQNTAQYNLGWFELNFDGNWNLTGQYGLAYNLYAKQQIAKSADNVLLQSVDATFNRHQQFSIDIPHLKLNRTYNDIIINNQTVAIDAPQSTQISETVNLRYSPHERALIGTALQYQYVSDVVVTEGSNTLVQGVDYAIKPNTGRIYGLKNIADKSVNVSYKGYNHRYDLIVANRQNGALSVIKGTERKIDPEHYQPSPASGDIELFLVYVTVNGCELLPVYRYRDYLPLDCTEQFYAMMRHNKLCVAKTLAKLYQKQAIKIIGYGDSITASGGGGFGVDALKNGGNRDRVDFLERIPQDTINSQVTLYDGTDRDFLGSPYSDHTKVGWNWILKSELEKTYGVTVTYHNWGIGGTSSDTYADTANGIYGGTYPQRLNAMLDDDGDLLVLCFGMNELGSDQTYANCRAIIEQFKARTGGDVVVVTTPMINKWGGASRKEDWLYTHDELVRCAIDTKSAYVSTYLLEHSDFAGNNRLSEQNMCNDNLYNHPTHLQLKHIGNMLSLIFKAS